MAPLGLEDQRRQLRTAHVGLHNPRADAALQTRGLRGFPERLLAVAVNAERLQPLHAVCEELPHRHNVVQLAGALRHRATTQRAQALLHGQDLLPLRRCGNLPLGLQ